MNFTLVQVADAKAGYEYGISCQQGNEWIVGVAGLTLEAATKSGESLKAKHHDVVLEPKIITQAEMKIGWPTVAELQAYKQAAIDAAERRR